jgi:hypothetical protein
MTVKQDRTESNYTALAAFESDTTLPDVVKTLTVTVTSLWDARNTKEYLRLYFSTFYRPSISVTGNDETLVVGAKQRVSEFIRRRQTQASPISWLFNPITAVVSYGAMPPLIGLIIGLLFKYGHWIAAVMVLLAFVAFSVYLWRTINSHSRSPQFRLVVRNESQGTVNRFITSDNVLLLLTALLVIVAVLAWLYPRTPAESSGAVTSSKPTEHDRGTKK